MSDNSKAGNCLLYGQSAQTEPTPETTVKPVKELMVGSRFVDVDVLGVRTELVCTAPLVQTVIGRWYVMVKDNEGRVGYKIYFPNETVEVISL